MIGSARRIGWARPIAAMAMSGLALNAAWIAPSFAQTFSGFSDECNRERESIVRGEAACSRNGDSRNCRAIWQPRLDALAKRCIAERNARMSQQRNQAQQETTEGRLRGQVLTAEPDCSNFSQKAAEARQIANEARQAASQVQSSSSQAALFQQAIAAAEQGAEEYERMARKCGSGPRQTAAPTLPARPANEAVPLVCEGGAAPVNGTCPAVFYPGKDGLAKQQALEKDRIANAQALENERLAKARQEAAIRAAEAEAAVQASLQAMAQKTPGTVASPGGSKVLQNLDHALDDALDGEPPDSLTIDSDPILQTSFFKWAGKLVSEQLRKVAPRFDQLTQCGGEGENIGETTFNRVACRTVIFNALRAPLLALPGNVDDAGRMMEAVRAEMEE